jgi:hypothetical protein
MKDALNETFPSFWGLRYEVIDVVSIQIIDNLYFSYFKGALTNDLLYTEANLPIPDERI